MNEALRRRRLAAALLLVLVSGSFVAVLLADSSGGTGGGTGGGGAAPPTHLRTVPVQVSHDDFGGGALELTSCFAPESRLANDATVMPVSATAPQLLLVTREGQLRGFGLSLPQADGTTSVTADTEATVLGSLLSLPGVGTPDVDQTRATVERIRSLGGYDELVRAVAVRLPHQPLLDVFSDPQVNELRTRLLGQLIEPTAYSLNPSASPRSWSDELLDLACTPAWATVEYDGPRVQPSSWRDGCLLEVHENGLPSHSVNSWPAAGVTARLTNKGFRYVHLVRRELDADGAEIGSPVVVDEAVDGQSRLGWGSLVRGLQKDRYVREPGTVTDDLRGVERRDVEAVEYWVRGLGFFPGPELPPSVADLPHTEADVLTCILYGVCPFVDIFSAFTTVNATGMAETGAAALKTALKAAVKGGVTGSKVGKSVASLDNALQRRDNTQIVADLTDLATLVAPVVEKLLMGSLTKSGPVGQLLSPATTAFGFWNFVSFLDTLNYDRNLCFVVSPSHEAAEEQAEEEPTTIRNARHFRGSLSEDSVEHNAELWLNESHDSGRLRLSANGASRDIPLGRPVLELLTAIWGDIRLSGRDFYFTFLAGGKTYGCVLWALHYLDDETVQCYLESVAVDDVGKDVIPDVKTALIDLHPVAD